MSQGILQHLAVGGDDGVEDIEVGDELEEAMFGRICGKGQVVDLVERCC